MQCHRDVHRYNLPVMNQLSHGMIVSSCLYISKNILVDFPSSGLICFVVDLVLIWEILGRLFSVINKKRY